MNRRRRVHTTSQSTRFLELVIIKGGTWFGSISNKQVGLGLLICTPHFIVAVQVQCVHNVLHHYVMYSVDHSYILRPSSVKAIFVYAFMYVAYVVPIENNEKHNIFMQRSFFWGGGMANRQVLCIQLSQYMTMSNKDIIGNALSIRFITTFTL